MPADDGVNLPGACTAEPATWFLRLKQGFTIITVGRVQAALFELMALMDISMLPMIIVLAMLRRMSIVLPFVYLNLLYQRYHHPAGAKYHQPVWSQFGNRVQPYKEKLPPALQRGIDWCVARFQTSPAHLKSPAQQQ